MKTLFLRNISKKYSINKSSDFYALKNINLSFPNAGLHAIVGKSGSGKSTLLNLIGELDEPSSGNIYLEKKQYSKKRKDRDKFFKNDVGIVFQQYHLLEDRTVLYNVCLPLLIKGYSKNEANSKAKECLKFINFPTELYEQKCSLLSGGEKQRVAIARAIIKDPKILLCDEPTGALDSANSIIVLDLLKKISKDRLVIVVSHNLPLVNIYSDRIIELSDGKIVKDITLNNVTNASRFETKIKRKVKNWTTNFSLSNYKKRIKRNILVCASLSISILMANIVCGFMYGKDKAIKNSCYRQLDFGSGQVSKEEYVSNSGLLKLVRLVRPDYIELDNNAYISSIFEICPNFSAILPQNIEIAYDQTRIDNLSYCSIYSFDNPYINKSMIVKGMVPESNNLDEVIINTTAYKQIKNVIKKNPVGEHLSFTYKADVNYVLETGEYITDSFDYLVTSKIVGVVDELDYLSTPKIYYSYVALEGYMQESVLNNLSTYFDTKITWYDRVASADSHSYISSYSYQLFLKDYRYRNYLFDVDIFSSDLEFTSSSLIITESLIGFIDVAKYALLLFMVISIIGAIAIISIMSFTNYSEDRKTSAILSSLGARDSEIRDIYLNESILSAVISTVLSLILSIPIATIANSIVFKKISVNHLIDIPFLKFLNVPLLYPLLFIAATALIAAFATLVPIIFSKKNSIKGELQSND